MSHIHNCLRRKMDSETKQELRKFIFNAISQSDDSIFCLITTFPTPPFICIEMIHAHETFIGDHLHMPIPLIGFLSLFGGDE